MGNTPLLNVQTKLEIFDINKVKDEVSKFATRMIKQIL